MKTNRFWLRVRVPERLPLSQSNFGLCVVCVCENEGLTIPPLPTHTGAKDSQEGNSHSLTPTFTRACVSARARKGWVSE